MLKHVYIYPLYFLAFDFPAGAVHINSKISVDIQAQGVPYILKGVVYFGRSHFICRYIDREGKVWVYDGLSNYGSMEYDTTYASCDFSVCRSMHAITAVYAHSPRVQVIVD